MSQPLKKMLQGVLPDHLLPCLVGSYDIVGDIAIIIIPKELSAWQHTIGAILLENHPNVKVVAKRAGFYEGEFRVLPLQVIAGEHRTTTEVREAGVRLSMDLQEVYYSVRSGGERLRVARLVQPGERVLVAFSGIAPYPLVIAHHSQAGEIIGVEKNGIAHHYGLLNLRLNKKIKNVTLYNRDILDWLQEAPKSFDRIIMPLPKSGKCFLRPILSVLSSGGCLHFYDMQQFDTFEESVSLVENICRQLGYEVLKSHVTVCGHCGPRTYRVCADIQIQ